METTNNPGISIFKLSHIPAVIHLGNSAVSYNPAKLTICINQPDYFSLKNYNYVAFFMLIVTSHSFKAESTQLTLFYL